MTIAELKVQYPNLTYEDGYLYENTEDEHYMAFFNKDKMQIEPYDANSLLEDHYEGYTIITNPNESDPRKEEESPVSGSEYIRIMFNGDYNLALKNI